MTTRLKSRFVIAIAALIALGAITVACKDFLNQPSQGTVEQISLETKAGVEGTLIAAYRSLDCSSSSGAWGCAASNWVWGSVTSGDAYKGSNLGDQQPINDVETYYWSVSSADGYLNQKWSQVYEGVNRANATLRLLAKVKAAQPNAFTTAEADGIRGEALFLRAHYHFEAYRMWGHIPYYFETDTTPVVQGGFRKPNDLSLPAVVDQIIADLDTARALLPKTPRGGDKGRATFWTAMAYKGRVQAYGAALTPAMWNAARLTMDSVRLNGPYALQASFDQVWTARQAYRNGPETILAFQASVKDGEPNGANSNFGERLNFPHSGSHFGCCGFHQPSFNLVNVYRVDSLGLPIAIASAAWNNPTLDTGSAIPLSDTSSANGWKGQNFYGGHQDAIDPRLDWTVGRDRTPYKDWTVHDRSWIRDASYSGPYSPKKNIHEQSSGGENNVGWQATQTNDVPMHIFRYADMLLLLAEAEVESGSLTNALTLVNQVRARAGKTAQGCGAPADSAVKANWPTCATDTTIQAMALPLQASATLDSLNTPWAKYRIGLYPVFPSQAYARQAVRLERRLELAMEGQRFFDERRWGVADTVIANYKLKETTRIPYIAAGALFAFPKYMFYPIPSTQIDLSALGGTPQLQQNPGW